MDDTNLVTWGNTSGENCRHLEEAHSKCESWATQHGATFAPNKYKLMHLQRDTRQDGSQATVNIQEAEVELCTKRMRMLGFWLDPKLLYTAMVRPVGTYGISVWAHEKGKVVKSRLDKIGKVQNMALCKVLGAYKRTPVALLETEAGILPITLYAQRMALNHALKTKSSPVGNEIKQVVKRIWNRRSQRPKSAFEELAHRADKIVEEVTLYKRHQWEERGNRRRARQRRGVTSRGEGEEEVPPDPPPKACVQIWVNM